MMPLIQNTQWYGQSWNTVPGIDVILWNVVDAQNFKWDTGKMLVYQQWMLHAMVTPGRCRGGSVNAAWEPMNDTVVHLYPPNIPFWLKEDKGLEAHRRVWILFMASEKYGLEALTSNARGFARLLDPGRMAVPFMLEMTHIAHDQEYDCFWMMQDMLGRLLAAALKAKRVGDGVFSLEPDVLTQVQDVLVTKTLRILSRHVSEPLSMETLARELRVGVTTITDRFKIATGETPLQSLRRLRLTKARALISLGLSLDAVAGETGFSDAFHLSREFKRAHGMSPRAFREQAQKSSMSASTR